MPSINVKEKLSGKKLDLSMCELDQVPVEDMLPLTKAIDVDLSCNNISVIPVTFPKLTHIQILDLSKNHIQNLPSSFGDLINLETLDLFHNDLRTLPISMYRLYKLKWLDIKDNPIHDTLRKVAGDCATTPQCNACAKNIVSFMKTADMEQEKARALKEQAEEERMRKERELNAEIKEREKQLKQREKELEKERNRLKWEETQKKKLLAQGCDFRDDKSFLARDAGLSINAMLNTSPNSDGASSQDAVVPERSSMWMFFSLFRVFVVVSFACVMMSMWCSRNPYHEYCETFDDLTRQVLDVTGELTGWTISAAGQVSGWTLSTAGKLSDEFFSLFEAEESSWW